MERPAGYRSVLCALMPNLSTQLHISPHEPTLSEHEVQEVQRFLSLNREREEEEKKEDALSGDGGKGLKDPSSTGKRRALKALTTSDSNIAGRIENGSLPKKQGLTLTTFLGGKENASFSSSSSSSSSTSSSMSDIFQRNRLPRRERCSRITSRRRPFVADLRNLDTNASAEYQIQDVYAFWQAVEERDAAEAIVNKLKGDNQVFPESNRWKLGQRRKLSQRRTSRLRGFTVELPLCTELMTEDEEREEGSCYTLSENIQLDGDHIPASQTVDSYQSDVTSEKKISDLDKERNSIRNENDILSETVLSPHLHLDRPSLAIISSPHMDMDDEAHNEGEAKDCNGRCQITEIASGSQDKILKNMCAVGPEGMTHEDVADVCDMLVVTPFVMRKKLQQKLTPYTSPTPPPNPLAGVSFKDEDNRRRLNFMEEKSSPDSEVPQISLDSDTPELEEPKLSVDTTSSHLQPMDSMDVNDTSDLESEIPISPNLRKGEDAALSSLASSMTTQNTVDERLNTEFSITTLPSKGNVQEGPLSSAGPPKKKQSRKRNHADTRRNSLAGAGMQWDDGVRRSTRIRSKPLDWWKGERFLRGRIHKSLVTVIGIKYASNSPCDPKKGPKFKVESYVPEEYLKLVEFAAL